MARRIQIRTAISEGEEWMSSTDLMAALMLLFMLIAIAYMINASKERDEMRNLADEMRDSADEMRNIADEWATRKNEIYEALVTEFREDLDKWHAEIERESLIVRFKEPRVLFAVGDSRLTRRFQEILRSFFPRYVRVLKDYRQEISEIRIEGHTSSEWSAGYSPRLAYRKNMVLSHDRTREVLSFGLRQVVDSAEYGFAQRTIIASGMSSSRLVLDSNGREIPEASRRVEFRVRTTAEERLSEIAHGTTGLSP